MTQMPPVSMMPPAGQQLKPHRGTVVLILGIIGLVCCVICGIIAWVLGSSDLKEMSQGRMDPSGKGTTQAGKICGMISVILNIVGFVIWLIMAIAFGTWSFSAHT